MTVPALVHISQCELIHQYNLFLNHFLEMVSDEFCPRHRHHKNLEFVRLTLLHSKSPLEKTPETKIPQNENHTKIHIFFMYKTESEDAAPLTRPAQSITRQKCKKNLI